MTNSPSHQQALNLLQQAQAALRQGQRTQARRLAAEAARHDPTLEDAWLVLGAVASPEASVAFLQRALEINPASDRARRGLQWALNRRQNAAPPPPPPKARLEDTAPRKLTAEPIVAHTQPLRIRRSLIIAWRPVLLSIALLLALIVTAGFFWSSYQNHSGVFAEMSAKGRPLGALFKPSLTPTSTVTPSPTATLTPTPTRTPKPTKTPTRRPTRTRTHTPDPTNTPESNDYAQDYSPAEAPAGVGDHERWIDVNLSSQTAYAYEGDTLINSFVVSTGTWLHPTVTGQFHIYVKYRYADMRGADYYLPDVPYVMYFYEGYGLHGTYWHNNFGTPMSHGCVNFRTEDAGWLFNWASVGTLVNVHY